MEINNKSDREFVVHGLGLLKPGTNEFSKDQVRRFKALTGKKLSDLESPTLEVKTTKAKKEDS